MLIDVVLAMQDEYLSDDVPNRAGQDEDGECCCSHRVAVHVADAFITALVSSRRVCEATEGSRHSCSTSSAAKREEREWTE
jgi:hypothetical protein